MNEVADSLLEQEKAAAKVVSRGAFKVLVPITKLTAGSLAASLKLVIGLTKGFTDLAIDGVNTFRVSSGKSDPGAKHRHVTGFGSNYRNINKATKKQGASLETVEVSDKKVLGFETIARQYGIDYGLKKNDAIDPPTWNVYFMAKDRATMTQAFKDFTNRQLASKRETPLEQFRRMASRVADHVRPEKILRQTGYQR